MTEAEWLAATDPKPMFATVKGRKNERKFRLFAIACCRRIVPLLDDEEAQKALAVAELFADGLAQKPQRRNAQHSILFGPRRQSVIACALNKVAVVAASRSSESVANRVAQIATQHFPEPDTTLAIHKQSVMRRTELRNERSAQTALLRDIFGNPFRPVSIDPSWLTSTVLALASLIYHSRDCSPMPILADALMDAGCSQEEILSHCRQPGEHVRGCWVIDLVLGKK